MISVSYIGIMRCRAAIPHGYWKTTTFTAGLSLDGMVAPMILDGPMNGETFLAYRTLPTSALVWLLGEVGEAAMRARQRIRSSPAEIRPAVHPRA